MEECSDAVGVDISIADSVFVFWSWLQLAGRSGLLSRGSESELRLHCDFLPHPTFFSRGTRGL
jgi:hypothetical protein